MVKWKWNVRNGKVIYVKEGFRFYILYDLKNKPNFVIEICLLRREEDGENISRQIPLRN